MVCLSLKAKKGSSDGQLALPGKYTVTAYLSNNGLTEKLTEVQRKTGFNIFFTFHINTSIIKLN